MVNTVSEQYLEFGLIDSNRVRTGDYYNVRSPQSVAKLQFSLFMGAPGTASVTDGFALYNDKPTLHLHVITMSATDILGTFEANNAFADSSIFLKVTDGRFHLPIR